MSLVMVSTIQSLTYMAVSNVAFLFFLALKNMPLAFLTAYSYERLNVLHQIAGYTTVLLSILHVVCVTLRSHILLLPLTSYQYFHSCPVKGKRALRYYRRCPKARHPSIICNVNYSRDLAVWPQKALRSVLRRHGRTHPHHCGQASARYLDPHTCRYHLHCLFVAPR